MAGRGKRRRLGRRRKKAKIKMALEMLADGEPIEKIIKYSKLNAEKINGVIVHIIGVIAPFIFYQKILRKISIYSA